MAEFKFKDNGIVLRIEGFVFRVLPVEASKTMANVAEMIQDAATEDAEQKELCGRIVTELNRMLNADRAIERIFESAAREVNYLDLADIVSYISGEVIAFGKAKEAEYSALTAAN